MSEPTPAPPLVPADFVNVARAQQAVQDELMSNPQVVGGALGHKMVGGLDTGDRALVVLVESKIAEFALPARELVPPSVAGIPTDVQAVGRLVAGPQPLATVEAVALTRRMRPVR